MQDMRTIPVLSFFGRSGGRLLLGGLALLLMFLVTPGQVQAQGCDNQGSISAYAYYCISATSLTGNNPQMPQLTYGGNFAACDTAQYIMELDFAGPGSYLNGESYGLYDVGAGIPGNVTWIVDWSQNLGDVGNYSEGGNGQLWAFDNGVQTDDFQFFVYGQNPSFGSITAVLGSLGAPWWYGHTLTWETLVANPPYGNTQFYYSFDPTFTYIGSPVWGYPDGYGLSQLDGSSGANPLLLTDDSLWTWTTNLAYGVQVANQNQTAAYNHFQNQFQQMLSDTAGTPQYPNPIYGYCNLTGTSLGSNYWNADWINKYNGGYWATWTGSGWSYGNSTNPTYTINVCNQPSHTI
jgi:hypothetical protein